MSNLLTPKERVIVWLGVGLTVLGVGLIVGQPAIGIAFAGGGNVALVIFGPAIVERKPNE